MCLSGTALRVDQFAKKVSFADIAQGVQPKDTLLAWRLWQIADLFPSVTLRSDNQSTVWTPGQSLKAHAEPKKDSTRVGIHAYKTIKDLLAGGYVGEAKTSFAQERQIIGQVLLWGKIAEHTNGFRAEYGYPFLIYANGALLQKRIAAHYGCQTSRRFIPRILAA